MKKMPEKVKNLIELKIVAGVPLSPSELMRMGQYGKAAKLFISNTGYEIYCWWKAISYVMTMYYIIAYCWLKAAITGKSCK